MLRMNLTDGPDSLQLLRGTVFVYNQVMSSALSLFRLQQVDSRISQVEGRLSKIRAAMENNSEIQAVMEKVKTLENKKREFEKSRQISEEEAREKKIKIQQAESSLYGGSVQNPKELLDLQADVASLKKHLVAIEDQELDAMLRVKSSQAELQSVVDELKGVEARLGGENNKLIVEQDTLRRDLAILQSERQATAVQIEANTMNTYETLRQLKRGLAVAEVTENNCNACGTVLNAALQQNARHAMELIYCPSCGRILFAG